MSEILNLLKRLNKIEEINIEYPPEEVTLEILVVFVVMLRLC
jgi:hypothetical protein